MLDPHPPLIHTFATPDLLPILARSHLSSLTELLHAVERTVDKVTVRSTNYEPRLLPHFPVHFVARTLPPQWHDSVLGPATSTSRARSASVVGTPHALATTGGVYSPATPTTPYNWPTQGERDELFLDSLASEIAAKADAWVAQEDRLELTVRPDAPPRRLPEEGEEGAAKEETEKDNDDDRDEGWKGRGIDHLTPWYAMMRDRVFARREMVEWETFGWPVACECSSPCHSIFSRTLTWIYHLAGLLALSTSHPDPLNALSALWDLTSKENLFSPAAYPPMSGAEEDGRHEWANPDILRYIVLVHDVGAGGGRDGWQE